jgi:hypothetical protein
MNKRKKELIDPLSLQRQSISQKNAVSGLVFHVKAEKVDGFPREGKMSVSILSSDRARERYIPFPPTNNYLNGSNQS